MGSVEVPEGVGESGSSQGDIVGNLLSDEGSSQSSEENDVLKKVDNLAKAVEGLQSLDGRRGNDIGHIKKMIEQMSAQQAPQMDAGSDSDLLGRFMSDPEGTLEEVVNKVTSRKTSQKKAIESSSMDAIRTVAPDFEDLQEDVISTIAKDVGASKQEVMDSLFDGGPGIPLNVYHRVKAEKRVQELESLVNALKNKGVDIEGARAFARGSSSGESVDSPEDPLANIDFRSLPKDQVQKLYQKTIANKQRR